MRPSKGTIEISTFSTIHVRKAFPFDGFTKENVETDLNNAAEITKFHDKNGNSMKFKFLDEVQVNSYGNVIKDISFQMIDFSGIHFTMGLPTASEEDQKKFRSWNKFWTELTKIGYKVK